MKNLFKKVKMLPNMFVWYCTDAIDCENGHPVQQIVFKVTHNRIKVNIIRLVQQELEITANEN